MGVGGSSGAIPNSGVATFFSRSVQLGILRAVSCAVIEGSPGPTDGSVVVFLSDGGDDYTRVSAILITGYVTVDTPLTWTGHIQLTGNESVVTRCSSLAAITLYTSFNIDIIGAR